MPIPKQQIYNLLDIEVFLKGRSRSVRIDGLLNNKNPALSKINLQCESVIP